MTDFIATPRRPPAVKPGRSMGLKLLLVCLIALLMAIPAMFVFFILGDRTHRSVEVTREISRSVGGEQTFAGPMLAIPFTQPTRIENGKTTSRDGLYIVFPKTADAKTVSHTSERRRGLFKTPVWTADVVMKSSFDLTGLSARIPSDMTLDWARAEVIAGVNDTRGARADLLLSLGGKTQAMSLTRIATQLTSARQDLPVVDSNDAPFQVFAASADGQAQPDAKFDATATLKFSGAESLAMLAYGQTTRFVASGDWSGPSYSGDFAREGDAADDQRAQGDAHGYAAHWSVPFVARGVAAEGESGILGRLAKTEMKVSFVEQTNPYQAVSRSLKYAPLFLGLVFLAYFIFETTQKKRVHPAQYVLIGLAQLIFYLLLLAVAERTGFDIGFAIAAVATVGLISAYAGWVFTSRRQGFVAFAAFSALYGLIYVLMRLQDWALLVGAGTSFAAIATVMYCTRNIDWYGGASPETKPAAKED